MKCPLKAAIVGWGLSVIVLGIPRAVMAQGNAFGSYPWTTPILVSGGYFDATDGNLHLEVPIASMPERGSVPFVAKLAYDSHIWHEVNINSTLNDIFVLNDCFGGPL
jgi:hypothetical protein